MKTCYSIDPRTLNPGITLFAKRVILRFIFCLETIFNLAIIFRKYSPQNSLKTGNKPQNNPQKKSHQSSPGR